MGAICFLGMDRAIMTAVAVSNGMNPDRATWAGIVAACIISWVLQHRGYGE